MRPMPMFLLCEPLELLEPPDPMPVALLWREGGRGEAPNFERKREDGNKKGRTKSGARGSEGVSEPRGEAGEPAGSSRLSERPTKFV